MRLATLHPVSALSGAGLVGLFALSFSQEPVGVRPSPTPEPPVVQVDGIPSPARLIEIREEDEVYSIPAARRLVLVWSWVEGPGGSAWRSIQLQDSAGVVFLETDGLSGGSGRVFFDGPRSFRVRDVDGAAGALARLVGYIVDR